MVAFILSFDSYFFLYLLFSLKDLTFAKNFMQSLKEKVQNKGHEAVDAAKDLAVCIRKTTNLFIALELILTFD